MIRYLPKLPSGRQIIVLLIVTNLIYALMLGYTIPTLMEYSSGLPIFDMSPMGYSYDQAMTLLVALGGEGRAFYLTQLALDMIYPAMFAMTYYLLFVWLLAKCGIINGVWQWLAMLPVLSAVADYLENISIWLMLSSYEDVTPLMAETASMFTVTKSMLGMLYWIFLLAFVVVAIVRWVRHSKIGVKNAEVVSGAVNETKSK
jgi:mannose/fructose/N-acetylgalactosamine-specific phosphotransferase system component IID